MDGALQLAAEYRYFLLLATVFTAQLAMVFPIVPVLVSAGALAGHGELDPRLAILAVAAGLLSADLIWYHVGRWQGARVLAIACRLALEPSACIRQAENLFGRYGARLLIGARFVPGLITAALPLAGMFRMYRYRFLLYDGVGVLLWSSAYIALGFMFAEQLGAVGAAGARLGRPVVAIVLAILAAYVVWRYVRRQRFLRRLRIARISAEELQRKLDAGERIAILDLRHPLDFEADPVVIPGALYIPAEELSRRHREVPRDRDVVLYCT